MTPSRPNPFPLPGGVRRVQLMATCLCNACYDDVAGAAVEVLEHLGCSAEFPERQTCCGQPAFNADDWRASRKVVCHTVRTFVGELPVVVPSSSCTAMLLHGSALRWSLKTNPTFSLSSNAPLGPITRCHGAPAS